MTDGLLVPAASPEPRLVGYARVSTDDQDPSRQIDALTKQGIPQAAIFMDKHRLSVVPKTLHVAAISTSDIWG